MKLLPPCAGRHSRCPHGRADTFLRMTSEEPPSSSSAPRVRRRPVVALSGWVLFVCLFLPTLRVCSSPAAPIEFPPAYGVYLGAAVIGVAALAASLRVRRVAHAVLLGLWFATGAGFLVGWLGSVEGAPLGWMLAVFGLVLTILMIAKLARAPWSVRGVIGVWIAHALLACGWNTLLVADKAHALWGAYLALGASGVMLVVSAVAQSSERAARKDSQVGELARARVLEKDE
jgi:hypothetical protein